MFPTYASIRFNDSSLSVDEADFVIFGVPIDQRVTGKKAVLKAPDELRRASLEIEEMSLRFGICYDDIKIADIGDVLTLNYNEALDKVGELIGRLVRLNKTPILIGGEHTFTLAAVKSAAPSHLLIFDAHLDLRDEYLGERVNHATYLRRVKEEMRELKVMIVGYRGFSRDELLYAKSCRIELISSREVVERRGEVEAQISSFVREAEGVYVSIDLDVLDPAFMSEVSTPEPEGLTPTQLMDLFAPLSRGARVIAADIMEFSPNSSPTLSRYTAAKVIYELLAALSLSKNVVSKLKGAGEVKP